MQEVILAIIGIVGGAVAGGGGMRLLDWLREQRKAAREELAQDRDVVVREYTTFLGQLRAEVHELRNQLNAMNLKHEQCLRENAALTAEVRQLQLRVAELSTGGGEALVVTDDQGHVLAWNPGATTLFGWSAAEAIGKDIATFIVPEEYRPLHQAAMERWRQQDRPPRGQPLIFRGQNKRGEPLLLDVVLTGYKAGDHWNLEATIRQRMERFD